VISVDTMTTWNVLGCSVRGSSHERTGKVNEDAYSVGAIGDAGAYAVLSDGHGSRACFRSAEGASWAVKCTEDVLKARWAQELLLSQEGQVKVAQEILSQWRTQVVRHLKLNPFTRPELDGLDGDQRMQLGRNALLAYGATLLMCCVLDREAVFIQLGDGDFLAMDSTGSVSGIFQQDHRHLGNATTSLCLPNALSEFQYYRWKGPLPRVFLGSTDGYGNSFRSESDFHRTVRDYARMIDENGRSAVEKQMAGWLYETSRYGSGDDITVALIYR